MSRNEEIRGGERVESQKKVNICRGAQLFFGDFGNYGGHYTFQVDKSRVGWNLEDEDWAN